MASSDKCSKCGKNGGGYWTCESNHLPPCNMCHGIFKGPSDCRTVGMRETKDPKSYTIRKTVCAKCESIFHSEDPSLLAWSMFKSVTMEQVAKGITDLKIHSLRM